ncbi:MAG: hypothetical protein IKU24_00615 [Clostridia bacterium]|nr:hypothetical protein [Clostridia bacterium]
MQRIFDSLSGALPESGITSSACTISQASGTLTIDKKSGVLSALTYTLSGKVVIGGAEGTFSARYSLLTDPGEEVQIPSMQEPTPTTPGMEGEGEVVC